MLNRWLVEGIGSLNNKVSPDCEAIVELARKGPVYGERGKIVDRNTVSGSLTIGYGVSKAQRGIAADRVISIARAIKALKGW